MKESRGIPRGIEGTQVLRITRNRNVHGKEKRETALVCEDSGLFNEGFCISPSLGGEKRKTLGLYGVGADFVAFLREGDIVKIEPEGRITLLWETAARSNALFLTDHCNSRCIMCPQRPEEHPCHHDQAAKKTISLLKSDTPPAFAITGGEPTVALDGLIGVLDICRKRFPEASVQLLTNGRRFSDFQVVTKVVEHSPRRLLFCIPLFADNDVEHDFITGAIGSFKETITGIHHLVRYRRPVEIRVVIVRQNSERLRDLAHFLFWNFPFAVHIAFMAMETSGVAGNNLERIWIEPVDYMEELRQAVIYLHQRMMNVSLYNLPFCLIPERIRAFARDSISDWKKTYASECKGCAEIASCGGLFATSVRKPAHLHRF
jgi:His-Xaa-Ser system radical SAM maturase HxsC